ncbi:hypothetical protein DFH09DRAFT_1089933 [Mycena vulgaris]|nr:hypothetical protein DFH09DRAFT_1089933 [Mycena vulgaris]
MHAVPADTPANPRVICRPLRDRGEPRRHDPVLAPRSRRGAASERDPVPSDAAGHRPHSHDEWRRKSVQEAQSVEHTDLKSALNGMRRRSERGARGVRTAALPFPPPFPFRGAALARRASRLSLLGPDGLFLSWCPPPSGDGVRARMMMLTGARASAACAARGPVELATHEELESGRWRWGVAGSWPRTGEGVPPAGGVCVWDPSMQVVGGAMYGNVWVPAGACLSSAGTVICVGGTCAARGCVARGVYGRSGAMDGIRPRADDVPVQRGRLAVGALGWLGRGYRRARARPWGTRRAAGVYPDDDGNAACADGGRGCAGEGVLVPAPGSSFFLSASSFRVGFIRPAARYCLRAAACFVALVSPRSSSGSPPLLSRRLRRLPPNRQALIRIKSARRRRSFGGVFVREATAAEGMVGGGGGSREPEVSTSPPAAATAGYRVNAGETCLAG